MRATTGGRSHSQASPVLTLVSMVVALSACGRIGFAPIAVDAAADSRTDAADAEPDAPERDGAADAAAPCTPQAPVPLESVNDGGFEDRAWLSNDRRTIYFGAIRAAGPGSIDIYTATRARAEDPFGPAVLEPGLNGAVAERDPFLTSDQLTMWLSLGGDFAIATRASVGDTWTVRGSSDFGSGSGDSALTMTEDGLEAYFSSTRATGAGGIDVFRVTRTSTDVAWETPEPAIASPNDECCPTITGDGLTLYYEVGGAAILRSDRTSRSDAFTEGTLAMDTPIGVADTRPFVTSDGTALVFVTTRGRTGSTDLWMAEVCPAATGE